MAEQLSTFPTDDSALEAVGTNIRMARLRRKVTATALAECAGISRVTLAKAEKGDSGVSIGAYASILSCLGLEGDLRQLASSDPVGRQLQDSEMIQTTPRKPLSEEYEAAILTEWVTESLGRWEKCLERNGVGGADPRRFPGGFWYAAFTLNAMDTPSLSDLLQVIAENPIANLYHPPFVNTGQPGEEVYPAGDCLEAWLDAPAESEKNGFWRLSTSGSGFLLRAYLEDCELYQQTMVPELAGRMFDWVEPAYRAIQILKFMEYLSTMFSDKGGGQFHLLLHYHGTSNRQLVQRDFSYHIREGGLCRSEEIEAVIVGSISEIGDDLAGLTYRLLHPIHEQFDFSTLPLEVIQDVGEKMRRRTEDNAIL